MGDVAGNPRTRPEANVDDGNPNVPSAIVTGQVNLRACPKQYLPVFPNTRIMLALVAHTLWWVWLAALHGRSQVVSHSGLFPSVMHEEPQGSSIARSTATLGRGIPWRISMRSSVEFASFGDPVLDHSEWPSPVDDANLRRTVDRAICEHSCIRLETNVCLRGPELRREPVAPGDPRWEHARDRVAMVFHLGMFRNPQHAVQEDGYPLLFYTSNCVDETHSDIFLLGTIVCNRYSTIFVKAAEYLAGGRAGYQDRCAGQSWFRGNQIRGQPLAEDAVRCYGKVRYLLDPLRSNCSRDLNARNDPTVLSRRRLDFNGLGLNISFPGVPRESPLVNQRISYAKTKTWRMLRRYLELHEGWDYSRVPMLHELFTMKASINITLVVRLRAWRRKQTNWKDLRLRIMKEFLPRNPRIRVRIAADDGVHKRLALFVPVETQLRVFHTSHVVIGVHGGALGSVFAMREGALLITQCPVDRCLAWESSIAHASRVQVEHVPFPSGVNASFVIVDFLTYEILQILRKYFNRSE